ncbi:hypothetical protein H4219_004917 [Mycoemilia scoparia]|uniref:Uncharacterized protein n=1 Tax=Mycoemilia scoparia TaxID=417184 RepID=A0A9W7ZQ19_9FUNG|nr:hypothetical protein H4219_004917 [Mycoemilia scoparia]
MLSVSAHGDIALWSMNDGRCIRKAPVSLYPFRPASVQILSFDNNGNDSPNDDIVMVSGKGSAIYFLKLSTLEIIHVWKEGHQTWVQCILARNRKDTYRPELITCTTDGVLRLWSFDSAIARKDSSANLVASDLSHDDFSPQSPTYPRSTAGSTESYSIESSLGTSAIAATGVGKTPLIALESTFKILENDGQVVSLQMNSSDDEFLVVQKNRVRVLSLRDGDIFESQHWNSLSCGAHRFGGGSFSGNDSIVVWDEIGNVHILNKLPSKFGTLKNKTEIFKPLFTVANPEAFKTTILYKNAPPSSAPSTSSNHPRHIGSIYSFANNPKSPILSIKWISQVNNQIEPSKGHSHKEFRIYDLWGKWLSDIGVSNGVTAIFLTKDKRIVAGKENGDILISTCWYKLIRHIYSTCTADKSLEGEDFMSYDDDENDLQILSGHDKPVTALLEWEYPTSISPLSPTNEFKSESSPMFICSASLDMTIRVWDTIRNETIAILPVLDTPVTKLIKVVPYPEYTWDTSTNPTMAHNIRLLILGISDNNSTKLLFTKQFDCINSTPPHTSPLETVKYDGIYNELSLVYADNYIRKIELDNVTDWIPEKGTCFALPDFTISINETINNMHAHYQNSTKVGIELIKSSQPGTLPLGLLITCSPEFFEQLSARSSQDNKSKYQRDEHLETKNARSPLSNLGFNTASLDPKPGTEFLGSLFSWGINESLDKTKTDTFGIQPPPTSLAIAMCNDVNEANTLIFPAPPSRPELQWCFSSVLNAQRLLSILSLIKSELKNDEQKAVEVLNYYVGVLADSIGPGFKQLPLAYLARYWVSSSATFQKAARTLFLSTIYRLSDSGRRAVLQYWSTQLSTAITEHQPQLYCALIVVCLIGSEYSTILPLTTAGNVAYLLQGLIVGDQVASDTKMLAIELFSRGFLVWKVHVDCPLVIRALMRTMISITDENGIGTQHQTTHMAPSTSGGSINYQMPLALPSKSLPGTPPRSRVSNHSPKPSHSHLRPTSPNAHYKPRHRRLSIDPESHQSDSGVTSQNGRAKSRAVSHHFDHKNVADMRSTIAQSLRSPPKQPSTISYHSLHSPKAYKGTPKKAHIKTGSGAISFNLVALAKSALMQICSLDTRLMVGTLLRLLYGEENNQAQRDALQLLSLLVNKYAALIYPFLDQVIQAVVKTIDPKQISTRKALIQAASTTLQDIVRIYSCVSFNSATQYLAVGSFRGLCTVYDLRTCTRSTLLDSKTDGHVTAVAISPKGDLVATFALSTSQVSIWNSSPSIFSMVAHSLWSGWYGSGSKHSDPAPPLSTPETSNSKAAKKKSHYRTEVHSNGNNNDGTDQAVPETELDMIFQDDDQDVSSNGGMVTADPIKIIDIPKDFIPKATRGTEADTVLSRHTQLRWTANKTILLVIDDAQFTFSV